MEVGLPLLAVNLRRQAMNASVVRSDTSSKWTALTDIDTNTQTYHFTMVLNRIFHIVGGNRAIRSVVRRCVTCRRRAPRSQTQMMGQLPTVRITPDIVFEHVGLDYAGPLYFKCGSMLTPVGRSHAAGAHAQSELEAYREGTSSQE